MSRTRVQKSPFTSRTRPPTRRAGSCARYAKSCSRYGYMQADVLPEPVAPMMAMPVYRPRSGMTSHLGTRGARRHRTLVLLAEDDEQILAPPRRRIRWERLRRHGPAPPGDKDGEEREHDVERNQRRAEPQDRVRVPESGVDVRTAFVDQTEDRVVRRPRPGVEPNHTHDPGQGEAHYASSVDQRAHHALLSAGVPCRRQPWPCGRARSTRRWRQAQAPRATP